MEYYKSTALKVFGNSLIDLFGNELPYPHFSEEHPHLGRIFGYYLAGYFGTKKGREFINDIVARINITCGGELYSLNEVKTDFKGLELSTFQNLKSLASERVKERFNSQDCHVDHVFWCLKLYAEDMIKQDGLISYSVFERFAEKNFATHTKDRSTLKAKCRAIYRWYEERGWAVGRVKKNIISKEEVLATRQERARSNALLKKERSEAKVVELLGGLLANAFKTKGGRWNCRKVADYLNMDRKTVIRVVKDLGL